jgi:hypothetical protein
MTVPHAPDCQLNPLGICLPVKRSLPFQLALLVLAAPCSRPEQKPAGKAPPGSIEAIAAEVVRVDNSTAVIASLIDPAKLETLKGDRAANNRLRKVAYWLENAQREGDDLGHLIDEAQAHVGYGGTARAREDRKALLRNLTILERLGCLTVEGMGKRFLRQPLSPATNP